RAALTHPATDQCLSVFICGLYLWPLSVSPYPWPLSVFVCVYLWPLSVALLCAQRGVRIDGGGPARRERRRHQRRQRQAQHRAGKRPRIPGVELEEERLGRG